MSDAGIMLTLHARVPSIPVTRSREEALALNRRYWDEELSLAGIAELEGCSRENIRQLFKKFDLPIRSRAEATALETAQRQRLADARREEIYALYRRHGAIDMVAAEIDDVPRRLVAKILSEMPNREAFRRIGDNTIYNRAKLIEHLRIAFDHGGRKPLGQPAYRKAARELGLADLLTIIKFFQLEDPDQPWVAALQAAGIPGYDPTGARPDSFTADDCIRAVEQFIRSRNGHRGSYSLYREWAKHYDVPSGPTIRNIVGWNNAVEQALERLPES